MGKALSVERGSSGLAIEVLEHSSPADAAAIKVAARAVAFGNRRGLRRSFITVAFLLGFFCEGYQGIGRQDRRRGGLRSGCWSQFFGVEPLGNFGFPIADELLHLLDFDGVVSLFVFSEQEQVGFVLWSIAMKEPLVLGLDRSA